MSAPAVCVLGLGTMGSALALRLRDCGRSVSIWNRSRQKAEALAAEDVTGRLRVAPTAAGAVTACTTGAAVIAIPSDTAAMTALLRQEGLGEALHGKTLVNLASANPDEGRDVEKVVAEVSAGAAAFVDGAYCGAPSKARSGTGQLFLSSDNTEALEKARPLLSQLGSVTACGRVGASRALDYAVVDLFFVNLLTFMSNRAALEREGVSIPQFVQEATQRLSTIPAALEAYDKRMAESRENPEAYFKDVTVKLSTARSYWASRLPYNQAHGIPSQLTDFYLSLLSEAGGSQRGPREDADISCLQDVVQYGASVKDGDEQPRKKARG